LNKEREHPHRKQKAAILRVNTYSNDMIGIINLSWTKDQDGKTTEKFGWKFWPFCEAKSSFPS